MKIKDIVLIEMPYLHPKELPIKALTNFSVVALNQKYSYLGNIAPTIALYRKKDGNGFVAGVVIRNEFYTYVVVSTRNTPYPVIPTQLTNILQVSMVNAAEGLQEKGITKSVYNAITKNTDLVSDHEQYLGAQGLWKSLARNSDANVYVFDGRINDYMRDAQKKIIKYNGNNINDADIWQTQQMFKTVLLVATTKNLK